jgi:hypothetical protein
MIPKMNENKINCGPGDYKLQKKENKKNELCNRQ